jgi:hypothetical protein
MSMFVDIAVGETLRVGDFDIRLQFKTGKKARIKIDAPHSLDVSLDKGEKTEFYTDSTKPT